MRHTQRPSIQHELFHPPRVEPHWQNLPQSIRREAVTLLTQLLMEYRLQTPHSTQAAQEVNDE
jgi:hypothetical protein